MSRRRRIARQMLDAYFDELDRQIRQRADHLAELEDEHKRLLRQYRLYQYVPGSRQKLKAIKRQMETLTTEIAETHTHLYRLRERKARIQRRVRS